MLRLFLLILAGNGLLAAQVLTNQSLSGAYWVRQIAVPAQSSGALGSPASFLGNVTFDGQGRYSMTGQRCLGASAGTSYTATGTYSVSPAGLVALANPLRPQSGLNARLGTLALVAASTESTDGWFDLLVAIPATATAASNATLTGPYAFASFELPAGAATGIRNSFFTARANGFGNWQAFSISGHSTAAGDLLFSEPIPLGTYQMTANGAGSAAFPGSTLLSPQKTLYASADAGILLAGSAAAGAHDLLIGIRLPDSAGGASLSGRFWGTGMRLEGADVSEFAGSANVGPGGRLVWSRRIQALGAQQPGVPGAIDYSGVTRYTLLPDGTGALELSRFAIGAGGNAFLAAAVNGSDPNSYEVLFGVRMPPVSGTGVFLNPQGVLHAASFAPAGAPVAPGMFFTLFGAGLSAGTAVAPALPFPRQLGGVRVLINSTPAPISAVAPGQISGVVPYSVSSGQAVFQVENQGTLSNAVSVPVAPASPGIFSLDQTGTGAGAILHADYSLVNAASPARPGEVLQVFLTGMGAVNPAAPEGTAAGSSPVSTTGIRPVVRFGSRVAEVSYSGLAPGLAGVYQINVRVPLDAPSGVSPLSIETPSSFHDQVEVQILR